MTLPPSAPDQAGAAAVDPELGADRCVAEIRRILARFGKRRQLAPGVALFDRSDASRHLYIVTRGTIDVGLPEAVDDQPIASFHAGACFLVDSGSYQVATLEASEPSEVIDVPFARLNRLCRQEMDLRLLMRQSHAFDLKSFLDICYPAQSRFRLVRGTETVGDRVTAASEGHPPPGRRRAEFLIPLGPASPSRYAGNGSRFRHGARRARPAPGGSEGNADGEE